MQYVKTIVRILQTILLLEWCAAYETTYLQSNSTIEQGLVSKTLNDRFGRIYHPRQIAHDIRRNTQRSSHDHKPRHPPPPPKKWKHRKRKHPAKTPSLYSDFSDWSHCDIFCKQKRVRHCLIPKKCGNTNQIEEKPCNPHFCSPLEMQVLGHNYNENEETPENHKHFHPMNLFSSTSLKRPIANKMKYYDEEDETIHYYNPKIHKPTLYAEDSEEEEQESESFDYEVYHKKKQQQNKKPLTIELEDFDDHKFLDGKNEYEYNTLPRDIISYPQKKMRHDYHNNIGKDYPENNFGAVQNFGSDNNFAADYSAAKAKFTPQFLQNKYQYQNKPAANLGVGQNFGRIPNYGNSNQNFGITQDFGIEQPSFGKANQKFPPDYSFEVDHNFGKVNKNVRQQQFGLGQDYGVDQNFKSQSFIKHYNFGANNNGQFIGRDHSFSGQSNFGKAYGFEDRIHHSAPSDMRVVSYPPANHKPENMFGDQLQNRFTTNPMNNISRVTSDPNISKFFKSFPKTSSDSQNRIRKDRHKREAIYDGYFAFDDDYVEDEGGKKIPGEDMLKIGSAGRKRVREKAVIEIPRRYENHYSKWSKWSKCTAKCTTRRFKRCKLKTICGNDVIREIAYCYTEGSFCEEWIGNQLYNTAASGSSKPVKPMRSPNAARRYDIQNAISGSNFSSRKGILQPEYKPQNFQCGIPVVRNKPGKNYMYNMLRIIGGKTARRGQWPWQVVILNRFKEAFCGGTLVSPLWILTAAHCVRKRLYVRLGEHNLQQEDGTEVEFRIEISIKHPKYDKKTVDNDVALLKLPKEMEKSNTIGYACLPERYQLLPTGHTCTIIGWGKKRHNDDAGTNILHEAEVPIITNDECRAVYHDYTITKNMFCAGHKRGRIDTCAGDSGGPLLCRDTTKSNSPWTIFGITSFGDGCGKKNKFGIYTKLPNYVDWIWSVINCNGNCRP